MYVFYDTHAPPRIRCCAPPCLLLINKASVSFFRCLFWCLTVCVCVHLFWLKFSPWLEWFLRGVLKAGCVWSWFWWLCAACPDVLVRIAPKSRHTPRSLSVRHRDATGQDTSQGTTRHIGLWAAVLGQTSPKANPATDRTPSHSGKPKLICCSVKQLQNTSTTGC